MATSCIGDFGAGLQFGDDAVERRQPAADNAVVIAGLEEPRDSAEQAAR
jgi:hypothetical protein